MGDARVECVEVTNSALVDFVSRMVYGRVVGCGHPRDVDRPLLAILNLGSPVVDNGPHCHSFRSRADLLLFAGAC